MYKRLQKQKSYFANKESMTKMFSATIKLKFFIEVGLMMEHGRRDRDMMELP